MKHFLHSLAARSIGPADGVQPRLPSRFEPPEGLQTAGPFAQLVEEADAELAPIPAAETPRRPESPPPVPRPVPLLAEPGTPDTPALPGNPRPVDRWGTPEGAIARLAPPKVGTAWPGLEAPAQPAANAAPARGAPELPDRAQPPQQAHPSASGEGGRQGAFPAPTGPEMPPSRIANRPTLEPVTFIERTIERVVMERDMPTIERAVSIAEATDPHTVPPPSSPRSGPDGAPLVLHAPSTPVRPLGEADRPVARPVAARMAEWPTAPAFATERSMLGEAAAPPFDPTPRPIVAETAVARRNEHLFGPATEAKIESPPPAPTIHVSIGRVEVRATPQASAPARQRQAASAPSLDDYLRQRTRGGGG
jgi:hypothetical protein